MTHVDRRKRAQPGWVSLAATCVLALSAFTADTANAQIATTCLRPFAIPDKWIERQTPPWDPTDTFDPSGINPDVYEDGYDPLVDQGTQFALQPFGVFTARVLTGDRFLSVRTYATRAGGDYRRSIEGCSGALLGTGDVLMQEPGNIVGPLRHGLENLITLDPGATWDPMANGGAGGVVNSAYAVSPRLLALPVFAPHADVDSSVTIVKIAGFFVSEIDLSTAVVHGFLTGWSTLTAAEAQVSFGAIPVLSARLTGPGSPMSGVPIEFARNGISVGTAPTDGQGVAHLFDVTAGSLPPGRYPITVRLAPGAGFHIAEEHSASLAVTPVPPEPPGLTGTIDGRTATLWWTPSPTGPAAESFIVEAGTTPGASDLVDASVGSITTWSAVVGPGTYYVRVRSVAGGHSSLPSNELILRAGPPGRPTVTSAVAAVGVLTVAWQPAAGPSAATHRLEFFSGPALIALVNAGVGTSVALPIPPGTQGTFGVRVTAVNAFGSGPPSAVFIFDVVP